MANKIRIGLIRCDTHSLWYGALMAEHDPLVLQRPVDPGLPHSHSWQQGACHRFFYTSYGDSLKRTAPEIDGFEIVKLWDEDRHVAEQAARVFFDKPEICDRFEQVSEGVDLVLIGACNFDGTEHLKLASPGLERGIPTFVDKPFADNVIDAVAILDLANKCNAPVFSLSIPHVDPYVARFRNRIPEVGEVNFATLHGYTTAPAGLVHTISTILHLFGPGIETVRVLTAPNQTSIFLDYGGKEGTPRHGIMLNTNVGERPVGALTISILGTRGEIHETVPGRRHWIDGTVKIIEMIRQMVETRETPPIMGEVVESIAVIEAFRKAETTGQPAHVAEFLS